MMQSPSLRSWAALGAQPAASYTNSSSRGFSAKRRESSSTSSDIVRPPLDFRTVFRRSAHDCGRSDDPGRSFYDLPDRSHPASHDLRRRDGAIGATRDAGEENGTPTSHRMSVRPHPLSQPGLESLIAIRSVIQN
jgi:hypothetical protein